MAHDAAGPGKTTETLAKQLALVIDLNVCVGCHACVTSCKEWNTSGAAGPLADENAYGAEPDRHLLQPRADLRGRQLPGHPDRPLPQELPALRGPALRAGVPDRRELQAQEDGIVLVDYDKCIGCKYCAWACPYGARELDEERQVMTKCTLCVDRIYDERCRRPTASRPA